MGHTMAEGILARAAGRESASTSASVSPGDHVVCDIDVAMTQDIHSMGVIRLLEEMGVDELWNPERVAMVMDHMAPSHTVDDADTKAGIRAFARKHDGLTLFDVGRGISHEVLPEAGFVRPGELIVGTDSHTVTHGALGAAGTGIGDTDMAFALATGHNWFRVPETINFDVQGTLGPQVSTKDVIMHIAGRFGTDVARYRAIEFTGPTVRAAPLDSRMTLTNMAIELGAKFGFTPVDDTVLDYVESRTDEPVEPVRPEDPTYAAAHALDVADLPPQVAVPHDVGNVHPIDDVDPVDVDQVFIGSCTNGKLADLRQAAAVLDGMRVDETTRAIITPASREIHQRAADAGLIEIFHDAGATVTQPTCGACPGLGMGVLGAGEVCMAAQNRNFRGRMGHTDSAIYLGSPATAAATAIEGAVADPREVAA